MENSWYGVEASSQRIVTTFIIFFFFLSQKCRQECIRVRSGYIISPLYTRGKRTSPSWKELSAVRACLNGLVVWLMQLFFLHRGSDRPIGPFGWEMLTYQKSAGNSCAMRGTSTDVETLNLGLVTRSMQWRELRSTPNSAPVACLRRGCQNTRVHLKWRINGALLSSTFLFVNVSLSRYVPEMHLSKTAATTSRYCPIFSHSVRAVRSLFCRESKGSLRTPMRIHVVYVRKKRESDTNNYRRIVSPFFRISRTVQI